MTRSNLGAKLPAIELTLGETIRILRDRKGVTQDLLARAAGITPATLGGVESGITEHPMIDTVRRIAVALGLEPAALFALPVKPEPVTTGSTRAE